MSELTPLYKLSADTVRNNDGELAVIVYGDQGVPDFIHCDGLVYRPERTCKIVDSENKFVNWQCSACGEEIKYSDNYCPNCGAKVME